MCRHLWIKLGNVWKCKKCKKEYNDVDEIYKWKPFGVDLKPKR